MKRNIRILVLPLILCVAGLLALQAMSLLQPPPTNNKRLFAQRINLALRQTADRLLDLAGNTHSTIPPVEQFSEKEYRLQLQQHFNYDSLTVYLEAALKQFEIVDNYYVTVTNCASEELLLGYGKADLLGGNPSCSGREQKADCYNFSVVFPDQPEQVPFYRNIWVSGFLALAFLLLAGFYFLKQRPVGSSAPTATVPALSEGVQYFGNSSFDYSNQRLQIEEQQQTLTFREAKLLQYFLEHPNQLLQRDAILAAVWEDEGIIVGRSLDVFVSRLRKILQADDKVNIVTVHGVGYRLSVE